MILKEVHFELMYGLLLFCSLAFCLSCHLRGWIQEQGNEDYFQGPLEFIGVWTLIPFPQHRLRRAFITQALLCNHLGITNCFMGIIAYDHMETNYSSQKVDYKQTVLI